MIRIWHNFLLLFCTLCDIKYYFYVIRDNCLWLVFYGVRKEPSFTFAFSKVFISEMVIWENAKQCNFLFNRNEQNYFNHYRKRNNRFGAIGKVATKLKIWMFRVRFWVVTFKKYGNNKKKTDNIEQKRKSLFFTKIKDG